MKKGVLYGVGVGPGEPELLSMKAARLIREDAGYMTLIIAKKR